MSANYPCDVLDLAAMSDSRKKLLFWVTEDWFFCSHRLPLAVAALARGYDVVVVTRVKDHGHLIENSGLRLVPLEINRYGLNPVKDLFPLLRIIRIYFQERPDIVHHVAVKPVLYGSIAARLTRVKGIVNAFAGFGYLFSSNDRKIRWIRPIVKAVFRWTLGSKRMHFIVQNEDDRSLLETITGAQRQQVHLVPGSGVDTTVFKPVDKLEGIPVVVLVSRLLRDKGVEEFVAAANILKQRNVEARFILVGDSDFENPAGISAAKLEAWQRDQVIEWWGRRSDIAEIFAQSHIACLPSYREGLPKVLIEAAAAGLPIVTTDVPGCRDVVAHDHNGLLVPVYAVDALADALARLIDSPSLRQSMGDAGRIRAENEFALEKITGQIIDLYQHVDA